MGEGRERGREREGGGGGGGEEEGGGGGRADPCAEPGHRRQSCCGGLSG